MTAIQAITKKRVSGNRSGGLGIRGELGGSEVAIQGGCRGVENQPTVGARMQVALDFNLDARGEFPL